MYKNKEDKADKQTTKHPLKTVRWAVSALQPTKSKAGSYDITKPSARTNGRVSKSGPPDVSLIQAARDGLLDIVEGHLESTSNTFIHTFDEDGYTALHHAARYNRLKVLELLIAAGGNVNLTAGHDEVTPLHLACRYDSGSATKLLLTQRADVNLKDLKGRTALHNATRRGHSTVTKMLLSVSSCDVNVADADHITPLIMAALEGNSSICELLMSRGASITQQDINDMTPLMWAASEGHLRVVALFLKAAQKQGEKHTRKVVKAADNEGNTALHLAVQNGSEEVAEILLNHYADVNCVKYNLATPLHVAASNGYYDIARLLIFHGANVNMKDAEQMTPIHKTALYNKVEVTDLLVKHGGDLNAKDKKNMLPLHHACWKGQMQAVEYLLDNGAQIAEADSSLKTALHWAVQFGHYETLVTLLQHGGVNTLEASDKNDQTVLHYAAYFGNVSVLTTLLDAGSKTDAKDQEERRPLHIAAQYDNMSCVEALIEASTHETNDDDVDGRTPLCLACTHGHHQVVQVLLSLGADVSKRDDEHRTSLMLAARHGHTFVLKILLDNQANVNDVDKNKNTALHYACGGGHVESVQLLLDKRADVTVKNTHDAAPLDLAIDNMHSEVAVTMLRTRSWRECLSVRDSRGLSVLDRLVEKLPEAAQIVLDHCVERTTRDDDDPTLSMVFDYQYIDPGPDEIPPKQSNRYFALNTMVAYERDILLSHTLCQNILSQKWVNYGRKTFFWNLFIYTGYLVSLNTYVYFIRGSMAALCVDEHNCSVDIVSGDPDTASRTELASHEKLFASLSLFFVLIIAVKELFKMYSQRLRYFFNFFNLIAWILMGATFAFILNAQKVPCMYQWRAGWIAMFFAWINFIMYLRRIDFVGIYVIMFVTVFVSLMKAILLFFFFSSAFASAFLVVVSGEVDKCVVGDNTSHPIAGSCSDQQLEMCMNTTYHNQPRCDDTPGEKCHFDTILHSLMNVFIMSLGEIEKVQDWLTITPDPMFQTDVLVLLSVFLFLMPIVLMNLLIGIAVGDIEKVQHNAYLKRIALQVDLLYQIENNMPLFLQRKVFVRRATIKPNKGRNSKFDKLRRYLFGGSRNGQFIPAEQKDKTHYRLDRMNEELQQSQAKMRNMQAALQQQTTLLQHIATKLNIQETGFQPAEYGSIPYADQTSLSVYDNVSVLGGAPKPDRGRYKSIRMVGQERPHSVII